MLCSARFTPDPFRQELQYSRHSEKKTTKFELFKNFAGNKRFVAYCLSPFRDCFCVSVKSSAAADMNRETDVEMNNTGAAKVANNSGNADGTAPTPVELQGYDAVDSVMRGIPHSKDTIAHISQL